MDINHIVIEKDYKYNRKDAETQRKFKNITAETLSRRLIRLRRKRRKEN